MTTIKIAPQAGPQEAFLSTPADVAFYGGAAGGGKSYGLLLEPLRHIGVVRGFGAVIFRRIGKQITNEGGLWDTSTDLYPHAGGRPKEYVNEWVFAPFNNRVSFAHMQYEKDRFQWQGAQIPLIGFDEGTHFTRKQFFYMLSRNRSLCGVRPYVRLTYNPVPDDDPVGGWIHEFVGWYLDDNGEYPDLSKCGRIRYFLNIRDTLHWFDERPAAVAFARERGLPDPEAAPKSFTFIAASVHDNKILLEKDPGYLANLMAMDNIDQERLLHANHKIRPEAGKVFNSAWFEVVDALPAGKPTLICRFWDLAASEKKQGTDPDFTAGVKIAQVEMKPDLHVYYVLDVFAEQLRPADTDNAIQNVASQDGYEVFVRWEEEGGASGKRDSAALAGLLDGYDAAGVRPQGDKLVRSKGLAAQAKAGNVKLVRGEWNERFLKHMHAIPDGAHDDIHDAAAGAYNELRAYMPALL